MTSKPLIFLAFLILITGIVAADAPPPIPCEYHGTLTIGGVPAPAGTIVQTRIYGIVRGEEVTTQAGQYEYLIAQITSSEASCGCTITVEFWVNGNKADQTSTFSSGGSKTVDLTVSGVAPPTTSPTTVPTTSPTTAPTTSPTTSPTTVPPTTIPTTSPTTVPPTTTIPTTRPTSIPAIPHAFHGTVVIYDSVPAPVGSVIEARASGVLNDNRNPLTTIAAGEYGTSGDNLVVQGYIETGTPIEFYVGGIRADCYDVAAGTGWTTSYPFAPGGNTELNLRTNISVPVADFSANPAVGYEPLLVQFTDLSDGPATSWLWEFGDGQTSNEQNPVHRYYNGNYDVTLTVTNLAGSDTLSREKYITVYRQSSPGGGGGGGGGGGYYAVSSGTTPTVTPTATPTPTPTVTGTQVIPSGNLPLNSNLALSQSVTIASQDNSGIITMVAGVRPTTALGEPLLSLSIRRLADSEVPPVPGGAAYAYAGYAYGIEPDGAAFDPSITLTITVSPEDWAEFGGRQVYVKWYNAGTSSWEDLPITVAPATGTVSVEVTHTSVFALFVELPPTTSPTPVPTTPPSPGGINGLFTYLLILIIAVVIVVAVVIVIFILKRRGGSEEEVVEEEEWKIE